MAQITKWIASGLGWVFLGPIGGIIGFVIGYVVDKNSEEMRRITAGSAPINHNRESTSGDFIMSLLVLVAVVMKADGKVKKVELDYVKRYFVRVFGMETAKESMLILREVLKKEIPVASVSAQIGKYMDYSSRLELLHFLFGISDSDGEMHRSELSVIKRIADLIGIAYSDYQSIKSMFAPKKTNVNYEILNLTPDATVAEIKKAYRKLATKYHPDKVGYLGDDLKKAAKEKFQKLNEAYDQIKKERGFV